MNTVAVMTQKGGSGKTTLTVNLAVAASLDHKQTGIVDLDPQGTSSAWGDDRQGEPPEVVSGFASRLPKLIEGAQKAGTQMVFLDLAPRAQGDHKLAAEIADVVLIPCRPSLFDLRAIQLTWDLCNNVLNKPTWIVFTCAAPHDDRELAESTEAMERAGFRICPVVIHQRKAFVKSAAKGLGVQELEPRGKGAYEIQTLYKWVCQQLNKPTNTQATKKGGK